MPRLSLHGVENHVKPCRVFRTPGILRNKIFPCWGAAYDLLAQDFDKLLRGCHANLLVVREREEVPISRYQVGGLCGDGAGNDHVVVGIAADGRRRRGQRRQVGKPAEQGTEFPGLLVGIHIMSPEMRPCEQDLLRFLEDRFREVELKCSAHGVLEERLRNASWCEKSAHEDR